MRSFFCLLVFFLGVVQLAIAQQNAPNLSNFPPGTPMAMQQQRGFQNFTRAQQKFYQAKVDSILALKRTGNDE